MHEPYLCDNPQQRDKSLILLYSFGIFYVSLHPKTVRTGAEGDEDSK